MTNFPIISILQTISWPEESNAGGQGRRSAPESSGTIISQHTADPHVVSHHSEVVSHCLLATDYQSANQLSEDQKS